MFWRYHQTTRRSSRTRGRITSQIRNPRPWTRSRQYSGPTFVYMAGAALSRKRCGKEYDRSRRAQRVHQISAMFVGDVLGHFETDSEIIASVDPERLRQIHG